MKEIHDRDVYEENSTIQELIDIITPGICGICETGSCTVSGGKTKVSGGKTRRLKKRIHRTRTKTRNPN